jgi:2-dehydro-3-deoxygluconokinase
MQPDDAPLVVTFGEALLRLTPPEGEPLREANSLALHVGGAEANVAVGLASLGLRARWFSSVATGELGERVLNELRSHSVDVRQVVRTAGRTGLYFFEEGHEPRAARITYDRAGSAFTALDGAVMQEAVSAGLFADAAAFLTTGITLALGAGPLAAARYAWAAAGEAGVLRCFDVNHRASLTGAAAAACRMEPFLADCELLFVAERDARLLYGLEPIASANPESALERLFADLRNLAPRACIVITRGSVGAAAAAPDGNIIQQQALPVGTLGRLGRGDAFAAGFLTSWLRRPAAEAAALASVPAGAPEDTQANALAAALATGVASASIKSTLTGDLARLDAAAVKALLANSSGSDVIR